MRYLIAAILLLQAGCGYHTRVEDRCAWLVGRDVMISQFDNRTTEPFLEDYVANAVVDVFSASHDINVVSNGAEMEMTGEVSSYQTSALSYDRNDEISEYRLSVQIKARLVRAADGKHLWRAELERSVEYFASSDRTRQQDSERLAAREAAERLAEDLRAELCLLTEGS